MAVDDVMDAAEAYFGMTLDVPDAGGWSVACSSLRRRFAPRMRNAMMRVFPVRMKRKGTADARTKSTQYQTTEKYQWNLLIKRQVKVGPVQSRDRGRVGFRRLSHLL